MVFQAQISKTLDPVPIMRDYIQDWERAHLGTGNRGGVNQDELSPLLFSCGRNIFRRIGRNVPPAC
jgi:hypothetical protein